MYNPVIPGLLDKMGGKGVYVTWTYYPDVT